MSSIRVIIFPAGAELLGTNPAGNLVAADAGGVGTGTDITAAIVPGSIRFTPRDDDRA